MRILFDARSVRTPAGAYVFRGLTHGWLADARVESVVAAIPPGFDGTILPEGVEPIRASDSSWLEHIRNGLSRLADSTGADVVFVPNGLPPKDARVVIYFQDLYHFHPLLGAGRSPGARAAGVARAVWRRRAAPHCRLAVSVSTDIHREVVRRLTIPMAMIPNGVDVGAARWTGGHPRVVVLGGRGSRKGEEIALRAWAKLHPTIRNRLTLDILGVEPEARRDSLRSLADKVGLDKTVTIEGTLPREAYLKRTAEAMLAVSCSRLEAFGLPVAEALAMGAPVLASDLPSHRELVARAGAGKTFASGDVKSLAAHLEAALNGEPPSRLTSPPFGWSWRERARQHVDAYLQHS